MSHVTLPSIRIAPVGTDGAAGDEVITSARVGKFASVDVTGAGSFGSVAVGGTEVISATRAATFTSLTVNGAGNFGSVSVGGTEVINAARAGSFSSLTVSTTSAFTGAVTMSSTLAVEGKVFIASAGNTDFLRLGATNFYDFLRSAADGFMEIRGSQAGFSGYRWFTSGGTNENYFQIAQLSNGGNLTLSGTLGTVGSPVSHVYATNITAFGVIQGGTIRAEELYSWGGPIRYSAYRDGGTLRFARYDDTGSYLGETLGLFNNGVAIFYGDVFFAPLAGSGVRAVGADANGRLVIM